MLFSYFHIVRFLLLSDDVVFWFYCYLVVITVSLIFSLLHIFSLYFYNYACLPLAEGLPKIAFLYAQRRGKAKYSLSS